MASESPQQSVFGLRFGDRHPWLRDALIVSTFIMTAFMKYVLVRFWSPAQDRKDGPTRWALNRGHSIGITVVGKG
ncbi:hypothetical protein F4809DRAFT_641937 [Biscogniauxia mediterranea]|nr:hypothetical protein F4809DRAFT_641937 [Biscogniauxia mediterranea]